MTTLYMKRYEMKNINAKRIFHSHFIDEMRILKQRWNTKVTWNDNETYDHRSFHTDSSSIHGRFKVISMFSHFRQLFQIISSTPIAVKCSCPSAALSTHRRIVRLILWLRNRLSILSDGVSISINVYFADGGASAVSERCADSVSHAAWLYSSKPEHIIRIAAK